MGDSFPRLDALAKAAKDRQDARRELRDSVKAFAASVVKHLRRGDSVRIGDILYSVENVTWWVSDPHLGQPLLCPDPEKALVRTRGERSVVLGDPGVTTWRRPA